MGIFTQPDSIVPEPGNPQALNRYSYVYNNPLKFVDSNGHSPEQPESLDEFLALGWEARKAWLQHFLDAHPELDGWFNDIAGAIDYLASDPIFSSEEGWAYYMDAAVLQAINDGARMYYEKKAAIGQGGDGWATFFSAWNRGRPRVSNDTLIELRLKAEQEGVNYAKSLPGSIARYNQASLRESVQILVFLTGADSYRQAAPLARAYLPSVQVGPFDSLAWTDPRTSWATLQHGSKVPGAMAALTVSAVTAHRAQSTVGAITAGGGSVLFR